MKFSVLIPVYNTEKYLDECLESVLEQTYQNFEIVLVDDGSTDNSGKICDRYQAEYPDKIKVIHQKNQGLLAARRTAIKYADSDFCIFVDSDDYIKKDTLEKIYDTALIYSEIDVILFSLCYVIDGNIEKNAKKVFADRMVWASSNRTELYNKLLFSYEINSLCTKAVKTALLKSDTTDYSVYYGKNMAEDLLQSLYIITHAEKIIYIDASLYCYNYNQNSISRTFTSDSIKNKSTIHVYNKILEYLPVWELNTEENIHRLNARWFNDTMFLFSKYCEGAKSYKNIKKITNTDWISLLPPDSVENRNMYENQTYQNLYKWYREKCNLKIYFFFMKKRVYKSIKKARRRTR